MKEFKKGNHSLVYYDDINSLSLFKWGHDFEYFLQSCVLCKTEQDFEDASNRLEGFYTAHGSEFLADKRFVSHILTGE